MSKSTATPLKSQARLNKHLALEDRIIIESGLNAGLSMQKIAASLAKDPRTVSKEIKRNRTPKMPNTYNGGNNLCLHLDRCAKTRLCPAQATCSKFCKHCHKINCNEHCPDFAPVSCSQTQRAPFVCNACARKKLCRRHVKYYYYASHAQNRYRSTLSDSRQGINLCEDELAALDSLISPLLRRGQALNHIYANHQQEIPCSKKTLYSYIDQSLLSVGNLDLPRKVRYKKRKKRQKETAREQRYRLGRTYQDFLAFIALNPEVPIVEMDTVEGLQSENRVLLTLIFRSCNLMLIYALDNQSQSQVIGVFNHLEQALGYDTFARIFPVILTDNGSEFKDPRALETALDGRVRTKVFYCDPAASWQKGKIEKNHELIRYVLPKGSAFETLSNQQVFLLRDHINGLARDSLNGNSPRDLADLLLPHEALNILNLRRIPADDIILTPHLLKHVSEQ